MLQCWLKTTKPLINHQHVRLLLEFKQWLCAVRIKSTETRRDSQQSPRKSNWASHLVLRVAPHNASEPIPAGITATLLRHKGHRVPLPFPQFPKHKPGGPHRHLHRGRRINGDIVNRASLAHVGQGARVPHHPLASEVDGEGGVVQLARVRKFSGAINSVALHNELNVFRGVVQGAEELNVVSDGGIVDKPRRKGPVWVNVARTVSPGRGKGTTCGVAKWGLGVVVNVGCGHECRFNGAGTPFWMRRFQQRSQPTYVWTRHGRTCYEYNNFTTMAPNPIYGKQTLREKQNIPDTMLNCVFRVSSGKPEGPIDSDHPAKMLTPGPITSGFRICLVTMLGPLELNAATTGEGLTFKTVPRKPRTAVGLGSEEAYFLISSPTILPTARAGRR